MPWQRAHSRLVFLGLTRLVRIPSLYALYFAYLKMRPFIQNARLLLPRRLYLPFAGLRFPRCSNTSMVASCCEANWTMRALTRWAIWSSTLVILRQRSALSCSPEAQMPVIPRLRAIRPSCFFLRPFPRLPPLLNLVARIEPSTVRMVHTARCSVILRSTEQIFVCSFVVICFSIFAGLFNCFSMGVCSHHPLPRLMRDGLPIRASSGISRPVIRTLIQLQTLPVHTLIMMEELARSFHWPAYSVAALFHERGGTGGRSVNFFPLACAFSRRDRHLERFEEKERADPRAARIAARLNMAGMSSWIWE